MGVEIASRRVMVIAVRPASGTGRPISRPLASAGALERLVVVQVVQGDVAARFLAPEREPIGSCGQDTASRIARIAVLAVLTVV